MNNNKKALKLQENLISNNLKNKQSNYWLDLIHKQNLNPILEEYSKDYRNRIYTPKQTLSMFLTQSCSIATGAYCKARKRLDKSMIENMCKNLALSNENKIKNRWKFRGRNVYLGDGTTITIPDTISKKRV
ncbi:hypothetical protein DZA35_02155 [Arcobacter sp. HD9-500m-PIT-SAG03]|nr:hypothetical protein DZA35_02155 [Arcobacter sp. HD9-500m-PIT-SAG03]